MPKPVPPKSIAEQAPQSLDNMPMKPVPTVSVPTAAILNGKKIHLYCMTLQESMQPHEVLSPYDVIEGTCVRCGKPLDKIAGT